MGNYLLKFFEKEQYLNDFLNGKLYMNTLKYFKENQSLDIARLDKFETIVEHKKSNFNAIQIGKASFERNKGELAGGSTILTTKNYDFCNILCLYSLWKNTDNEHIEMDTRNKIFGNYCIVITNVSEFLKRIIAATNRENFVCYHAGINYISKNQIIIIEEEKIPFTKFDSFSYQREFRIAINTQRNIDEPYILDIGEIRDIIKITTFDNICIIN